MEGGDLEPTVTKWGDVHICPPALSHSLQGPDGSVITDQPREFPLCRNRGNNRRWGREGKAEGLGDRGHHCSVIGQPGDSPELALSRTISFLHPNTGRMQR